MNDFYTMGQKHAEDAINEIKAQCDLIEQQFGKNERIAFELGVASLIDPYANTLSSVMEDKEDIDKHLKGRM